MTTALPMIQADAASVASRSTGPTIASARMPMSCMAKIVLPSSKPPAMLRVHGNAPWPGRLAGRVSSPAMASRLPPIATASEARVRPTSGPAPRDGP